MGWTGTDPVVQQLLRNAYLFEHPTSYQAGVLDTLALFGGASEEQPEVAEQLDRPG